MAPRVQIDVGEHPSGVLPYPGGPSSAHIAVGSDLREFVAAPGRVELRRPLSKSL